MKAPKSPALLAQLADLLEQHPEAVVMEVDGRRIISITALGLGSTGAVPLAQALRRLPGAERLGAGLWRVPPDLRPAPEAPLEPEPERCRTCGERGEINAVGDCYGCWTKAHSRAVQHRA